MVAVHRSSWLAAVVVAGTMVAACGSGGGSTASVPAQSRPKAPAAGAQVDPAAVKVIRAWSDALRHGDVSGAASYFALPSAFVNGVAVTIHTENQAVAVNAALPCGAVLISTTRRGRYISALFRLTDRPGAGGGCASGVGQLARTDFIVARGRIVEWLRAPENPGGGRRPAPSGPPAAAGPQV